MILEENEKYRYWVSVKQGHLKHKHGKFILDTSL